MHICTQNGCTLVGLSASASQGWQGGHLTGCEHVRSCANFAARSSPFSHPTPEIAARMSSTIAIYRNAVDNEKYRKRGKGACVYDILFTHTHSNTHEAVMGTTSRHVELYIKYVLYIPCVYSGWKYVIQFAAAIILWYTHNCYIKCALHGAIYIEWWYGELLFNWPVALSRPY